MCGRYAITSSPERLREAFGYAEEAEFPPRYNIAPTQPVPILRNERRRDGATRRHFVLVRFGFIPSFVKEPRGFPVIINARAETALEKPSFRAAVMRRRCLFIADAFTNGKRVRGQSASSWCAVSTPRLSRWPASTNAGWARMAAISIRPAS